MPAHHNLTIRIPLPSMLPAEAVIETLQSQSPALRHQPLITRFEKVPVRLDSIVDDDFFLDTGLKISSYVVYEKVTVVPGIKKEISFPAVLQNIPNGLRARASAPGGVIVRSEWLVVPRPEERWPGEHSSGKLGGYVDGDYELVENVSVETSRMLMPLVKGQMEGAHRELLRKMLDEVAQKVGRSKM
ncbi:hypothetical protein N0V92_012455 [Colletotrichum tropicale]|nr:hypothetical protein N0V92_012455 [Colletotrichum tropicale]